MPGKMTEKEMSMLRSFYTKADFAFWENEVNAAAGQCASAESEDSKRVASIRVYSLYMQLVEVFGLNMLAFSSADLGMLYLKNSEFRGYMQEQFQDASYVEYLLDNWVFGFRNKSVFRDLEKRKQMYRSFLGEAVKDYLRDYDLLNAYKHGFRLRGRGESSVSVQMDGSSRPRMRIGTYNSSIVYFSREKGVIFENTISFNWERVHKKTLVLANMLNTAICILLANGREITLTTLVTTNDFVMSDHFGSFRVKHAFVLGNI